MKKALTKEQHDKLQQLGIDAISANDIAFLLELLPKEIGNDGYMTLGIEVQYDEEKYFWKVLYYDCAESVFVKDELIDALFDLVVWCVRNGVRLSSEKTKEV